MRFDDPFTRKPPVNTRTKQRRQETFEDFQASELFCPQCRQSVQVREKLLLVLPDGDLYDYLCSRCGTSVGQKKDKSTFQTKIVHQPL